ncbi:methyltransferase domain-containing protein [Chloroflexota bacterium]
MTHKSAWSDPSLASAEDIARMATHLEDRATRHDQSQVNRAIRDALAPQPGERLLEVGSGTGLLCRLMLPDSPPYGLISGLDFSPGFNRCARKNAHKAPGSSSLQFITGQAENLPYQDNCFDGAWAARLILHAAHPIRVIAEMVRVVRPSGRIVLADWDFGTVAVDHPNRELTRRLLQWRSDHHGGDNWSGRQLYRQMQVVGLRDVQIIPVTVVAREKSAALTLSLWRSAEVALNAGAITAQEHDSWIMELKERITNSTFFASITYFIVKGRK